jgi:hypothetical protein
MGDFFFVNKKSPSEKRKSEQNIHVEQSDRTQVSTRRIFQNQGLETTALGEGRRQTNG